MNWAYLAGFLDGEGCFKIYRGYPRITVGQNSREVLDQIKEFLGIENAITWSEPSKCFYLQIQKKDTVISILNNIMPYLIVKKAEAQLILDHWDADRRLV